MDDVFTPAVLRSPRAAGIPETIDFLPGRMTSAVVILAVDDGRLVRMQPPAAGRQTLLQYRPHLSGLGLAATVAEGLISVTLAREERIVRRPPPGKRLGQTEIGQHGRQHRPWRAALLRASQRFAVQEARVPPPLDEFQHAAVLDPCTQNRQQRVVL